MVRILSAIIMAVFILIGCSEIVKNNQINTPSIRDEKKVNSKIEKVEQIDRSGPSNNCVKTYTDETHKNIQYGKLSFDIGLNHIVSDILGDNSETFKCVSDKGKVSPENHITITVQEIKKQDFSNMESIILYLRNMSVDYEEIVIYNNVIDNSGIINLYSITGSGLTNYVVCYTDACYLLKSDSRGLDAYLFKQLSIKANYKEEKQKIECANSFTAFVNKIIFYDDNKVEYDLIQGRDGKRYLAELVKDEDGKYNFTLKNEKGKPLLTISTDITNVDTIIKFLDVNMDGYADIQFLDMDGTLNRSYDLYVWDDTVNNFVKVKCDEMLSYFEVHDGYLQNWQKGSAFSGVIQKLVWDKNTLIKETEEPYSTN